MKEKGEIHTNGMQLVVVIGVDGSPFLHNMAPSTIVYFVISPISFLFSNAYVVCA